MRRGKSPQNINEELNKMRRLMNFDISQNSHDVLSESNIEKSVLSEQIRGGQITDDPFERNDGKNPYNVPFWGIRRKGSLNFQGNKSGVMMYALLKNRKLDDRISKKSLLYVSTVSAAPRLTNYQNNDDNDENIVINIEIGMDLQDPFKFDLTELTDVAKNNFDRFITDYEQKKEDNITIWDKYLNFLKSKKPIIVNGWASRDGDPEAIIADTNNSNTKTYEDCRVNGGRTRESYNLCLSQKRAEKIVELLEEKIPELRGIFSPVGNGETTQFNGIGWTENNSPSNSDTAPNRRFQFTLPKFEYQDKNVDDNDVDDVDDNDVSPSGFTQYIDMSDVFGVEAKIPAKILGAGTAGLDVNYLNKIADQVGEEKYKTALPNYYGGAFCDSQYNKGKITSDGFTIKTNYGDVKFNNWSKVSKEKHFESVAPRLYTDFRIVQEGRVQDGLVPVSLTAIALILDRSNKGKGVNVYY